MSEILKSRSVLFNEVLFTAEDLDSLDSFKDTIFINDNLKEDEAICQAIIVHLTKKHPIASLTGNSYSVEEFEYTGRIIKKEITVSEIQPRDKAHKNIDTPEVNFG